MPLREGRLLSKTELWDRRNRVAGRLYFIPGVMPDRRFGSRIIDYPCAIGGGIQIALRLFFFAKNRALHGKCATSGVGLRIVRKRLSIALLDGVNRAVNVEVHPQIDPMLVKNTLDLRGNNGPKSLIAFGNISSRTIRSLHRADLAHIVSNRLV